MKFIELHEENKNEPIYVNVQSIISFEKFRNSTRITLERNFLDVSETPSEIIKMLED